MANCRYMTGSNADSEDLTQEVFLKAFFALPRFEGRSAFRTWIQRIKVNHCLNHLKKLAGRSFVPVEDLETVGAEEIRVAPQGERSVHSTDQRATIQSILDSMPETLRVPLVLRDMDQFPYQEIADTLGIGLSAVKMRIKRARADFQARYQEIQENQA